MIAKDQMHARLVFFVAIDVVQPLSAVDLQMVVAVAREVEVERAAKHTFVGRHPLHTGARCQLQRFFRDAAFRRPQALRTHTEKLLVRIERTLDLQRGIVGMLETPRRQRQSRRRLRARIRIAEQRQNRMIERRCRKLDRSALRRLCIRGQNLRQHLALFRDDQLLILAREVFALLHQCRDVGIRKEKLVKPRQLRQHLQICVIARNEVRLGSLGPRAGRVIPVPQVAIARIAPNHVHRVRLKQILQRESALGGVELARRLSHHVEERIVRLAGDIVLNLRHQRRHQIEVLMDARELVQQLDHAVIVLQRMQPHPRQAILARHHVFVKRLMHVPQQHQPNLRRICRGTRVTHGRNLRQQVYQRLRCGNRQSFEPRATSCCCSQLAARGFFRVRMRFVVHVHHVLHGQLRVALCGREPLVAEHLLNRAQVSAFLQHVRTKGMT